METTKGQGGNNVGRRDYFVWRQEFPPAARRVDGLSGGGAFQNFCKFVFCPVGTGGNSPPIYRWGLYARI